MSATPHANGGLLTDDLDLPDFRDYAVDADRPGHRGRVDPRLGEMTAEIYRRNPHNFRLFCPDETNSNRLGAVFEVSDRAFMEQVTAGRREDLPRRPGDGGAQRAQLPRLAGGLHPDRPARPVRHLRGVRDGQRVADHPAQQVAGGGQPPAVAGQGAEPEHPAHLDRWRNDHNGFSHQGPGLIQNVITQRGDVSRVYLPPDANCLLSVADHCLRSRSYVNLIVIDKQPQQQWLTIDEAIEHCADGAGIWAWAGTDDGSRDPDIVLACAGDVVTMETVAAAQILQERLPELKVRVVNVVDLMTLPRPQDHPHGMLRHLLP